MKTAPPKMTATIAVVTVISFVLLNVIGKLEPAAAVGGFIPARLAGLQVIRSYNQELAQTIAITALADWTRVAVVPAANRFRVTQSMGDVLAYSGAMRRLAMELSKIASDLRLLSMGPRAGTAVLRSLS